MKLREIWSRCDEIRSFWWQRCWRQTDRRLMAKFDGCGTTGAVPTVSTRINRSSWIVDFSVAEATTTNRRQIRSKNVATLQPTSTLRTAAIACGVWWLLDHCRGHRNDQSLRRWLLYRSCAMQSLRICCCYMCGGIEMAFQVSAVSLGNRYRRRVSE